MCAFKPGMLLLIFFSINVSSANENGLQVRDIWSGRPIPDVQLVCGPDTFYTDYNGCVSSEITPATCDQIKVSKSGYFPAAITLTELQIPVISLTPTEPAQVITIIAEQTGDRLLASPSHTTSIYPSEANRQSATGIETLLQGASGLHIRSYGASGQLHTVSVRGMSTSQTQILFDDIPLNSLQLGSANLSQYDVQNVSSLEIYRGGNATFGGGAIGGVVNIHPTLPKDKLSYAIKYQQASFSNKYLSGSISLPLGKLNQTYSVVNSSGKNNYKTGFEGQTITLSNRDYKSLHAIHQALYKFYDGLSVDSYLSSKKHNGGSSDPFLGPAAEGSNKARLKTDNTLAKLKLKLTRPGGSLSAQGYIRNEWLAYSDTSLVINNQPTDDLYFNSEQGVQLRGRCSANADLLLSSGMEAVWQKVNGSYIGLRHRNKLAGFLLSDYRILAKSGYIPALNLNGSMHLEKYSGQTPVFLPALGLTAHWENQQVYISASKNYRSPTFNDLYWQPNGNPNLEMEQSLNTETGINWNETWSMLEWKVSGSLFANWVKNEIQWMPDGSFWRPQNIASVFSRGIEFDARLGAINQPHQLSFNYTFLQSEKNKATIAGDNTVGNQLALLPREKWRLDLQSGWRKWLAGVSVLHSSFCYLTIDNKADAILPSYTTIQLWSNLSFEYDEHTLAITLKLDNLFNENYQVYPGYPMPPRNYGIGLSLEY
jgi:iron complex outermembrane receptor protein